MTISDVIEKVIREAYQKGATQTELAKKFGVTQQHVCDLLSGKRKFDKLELSTLQKMFPQAEIVLTGGQFQARDIHGDVKAINSPNAVVDNNFLSDHPTTALDNLHKKINEILLDSDLSDAQKVKIIKILTQE